MARKNLSKRRKQSRINSRKNYQSKRRNLHTKKRKKYTKRRNTKRYKRNNLKFGGLGDDSESVTNVVSEFVTNVEYIKPTSRLGRIAEKASRELRMQQYKITTSDDKTIIMSFKNILEAFEMIAGLAAVPGGEGINYRENKYDTGFKTEVSDIQRYANNILNKLKRGYNSNEASGETWCNEIKLSINDLYRELDDPVNKYDLGRFTSFINQHEV